MDAISHTSERIVIVGGGFAGLAAAVRLAQAGLAVTVLEASKLGYAASSRNQGWLYSGGWYAPAHPDLAALCQESLRQTLEFCPECVEPGVGSMIYLSTSPDTGMSHWTQAWAQVGIPHQQLTRDELEQALPGLDRQRMQFGYRLPDRSFRPDVLLSHLAATARNAGAEIRPDTFVTGLLESDRRVYGVAAGAGEQIRARLVILAAGAATAKNFPQLFQPCAGRQAAYELVCLKTHLRAVRPEIGCDPFCVVDGEGLNHLPHRGTSVFGTDRWNVVTGPVDQDIEPEEIAVLDEAVRALFPEGHLWNPEDVSDWAGTTVQAMHVDQVAPGEAPLPTVVDHSREPCAVENVLSIYPGRATLWAHLAEQVRRSVLDLLGSRPSEVAAPPWQIG